MKGRRNFIKTGAALVGTGMIGNVEAGGEKAGISELGIKKEVHQLISEGKNAEAESLLDENDVKYNKSQKVVGDKAPDGEISQDWYYTESGTVVTSWLIYNSGDVWDAHGSTQFYGENYSPNKEKLPNHVNDGCAIVYDSSEWTAIKPDDDGVSYSSNGDVSVFHDEYNPNYGPAAQVSHEVSYTETCSMSMQTELTRVESGNDDIPVQFAYEHEVAFPGAGNIDVSVTAGGLSITLPLGAETVWREEVSASPS